MATEMAALCAPMAGAQLGEANNHTGRMQHQMTSTHMTSEPTDGKDIGNLNTRTG